MAGLLEGYFVSHSRKKMPVDERVALAHGHAWCICTLKCDAVDLGHEAEWIGAEERRDDLEHGVTEAADVQDVATVRCLRRRVGPHVDKALPIS